MSVSVIGTIKSLHGFGRSHPSPLHHAYVRYRWECSVDREREHPAWTLLDGAVTGHSHTCRVTADEDVVVMEHPVEAHFSCASLVAWPQMIITVWAQDDLGRNDVAGYGVVRVPPSPGVHVLEVVTWRPEGSLLQEIGAMFRGGLPQLTDVTVMTDTQRRYMLSTASTGTVLLELNVMLRGFDEHGVEFAAPGGH